MAAEPGVEAITLELQQLAFSHYKTHYQSVRNQAILEEALLEVTRSIEDCQVEAKSLEKSLHHFASVQVANGPLDADVCTPLQMAAHVLELPAIVEAAGKQLSSAALDDCTDVFEYTIAYIARRFDRSSSDELSTSIRRSLMAAAEVGTMPHQSRLQQARAASFGLKATAIQRSGLADGLAVQHTCRLTPLATTASGMPLLSLHALARVGSCVVDSATPVASLETLRSTLPEVVTCAALLYPNRGPAESILAALRLIASCILSGTDSEVAESAAVAQQATYAARRLSRIGLAGLESCVLSNLLSTAQHPGLTLSSGDDKQLASTFNQLRASLCTEDQAFLMDFIEQLLESIDPFSPSVNILMSSLENLSAAE